MSSALYTAVPDELNGSNYLEWHDSMQAFLFSTDNWLVIETPRPDAPSPIPALAADGSNRHIVESARADAQEASDLRKVWDSKNIQVIGHLRLRTSQTIRTLINTKKTAKEIWDFYETSYGKPGVQAVYSMFKKVLSITVSDNTDPTIALDEMAALYDRLAVNEVSVAEHLKAMILMAKLPSSMESSVLFATAGKKITELNVQDLRSAIMMHWDQKSVKKQGSSAGGGNANKLSAIKRKEDNPSFSQQQSDAPSGGNDGNSEKKKTKRGKRAGRQQAAKDAAQEHAHIASSAQVVEKTPTLTDLPRSIPDPRALGNTPIVNNNGTPAFPQVRQALTLAHRMGVPPNYERIRILEEVAPLGVDIAEDTPVKKRKLIDRIDRRSVKPSFVHKTSTISVPSASQIKELHESLEKLIDIDSAPDNIAADQGSTQTLAQADLGGPSSVSQYNQSSWYEGDLEDMVDFEPSDDDDFNNPRSVSNPLQEFTCADGIINLGLANLYLSIAACNYNCNPTIVPDNKCVHLRDFSACTKCKGKKSERSLKSPFWILDSGASLHFTHDLNDFIEYHPLKDEDQLTIATANSITRTKGIGVVQIVYKDEFGHKETVRISPVYHIPDLTARLLSLGQFLQHGMTVGGDSARLTIYKHPGQVFMNFCPRRPFDSIYVVWDWLETSVAPDRLHRDVIPATEDIDYDVLHRRFGHPSKQVLRNLPRSVENLPPNINIPSKDTSPCPGCAKGKMPAAPHPLRFERAKSSLELIHSDVMEYPVISYHKYKWAIVFVDDFSGFGWSVNLRTKDAALTATKHFITMIEKQYPNLPTKRWMSDSGGEYTSTAFQKLLKDKGIIHIRSAPYTHQQNGRAERFIRTMRDKSESLRLEACLPDSYWEFAVEHAVHVYNRTPMRRQNWVTPFELLNGKKPDVKHLRVFGCGAYVHIPEEIRKNKLAPKSELMVYLGVAEGGIGYKFMRSPNYVIFTSSHALFDEKHFPRCKTSKRTIRQPDDAPKNRQQELDRNPNPSQPPFGQDDDLFNPFPPDKRKAGDGNWEVPPAAPPAPPPDFMQPPAQDEEQEEPAPPPTPPLEQVPEQQGPRRSARENKGVPPLRPGNVFGERRKPTDILQKERGWKYDAVSDKPIGHSYWDQQIVEGQQSPGSSSSDTHQQSSVFDFHSEVEMAKLCQEGGVGLVNYLLAKAIPPDDNDNVLLGPAKNVREWSFRDVQRLPAAEQSEWHQACLDELEALRQRQVYELVDRPKDKNVIKCRWVFDLKTDGRKKARLVAKGFTQVEGIDFDEIFSPVVRFETARLMFALAALKGWHASALDVKSAFLYGELEEELYMEQPEGFRAKGQEHKVWRLLRAIYGLHQAAIAWWRALDKSMIEMGFRRIKSDAGIFIYVKGCTFVVVMVYVDDGIFFGPDKALVERLKIIFMKRWECRDLGPVNEFLRMRIRRDGSKILIDQCAYLEKVLDRCQMINAKPAITPLPAGFFAAPNTETVNPELRRRFQMIIGSLLYIMLGTRPDIAFAVTLLSRHAANPSQDHLNKALYICRYLLGTRNYALVFDGATGYGLEAYTDSDWGTDPTSRRSTTGYYLTLANGIFSWVSRTQKTIALSSTEAEYMALSDCSRQVVWIKQLLQEIGINLGPIPICGDNQGSIFMANNPITEKRSKHIDIRYHYIREVVAEKKVELFFIPGDDNPADLFTKNLGHVKFLKFRPFLGLQFFESG